MPKVACLFCLLTIALAGCGVESLGTAAATAKQQQQALEQAQKLKEDLQKQLSAAQELEQQRLKEAEGR